MKKVSSPHYLNILTKLSKLGLSYSLKHVPRSISKNPFYANLRVSPIHTELCIINLSLNLSPTKTSKLLYPPPSCRNFNPDLPNPYLDSQQVL